MRQRENNLCLIDLERLIFEDDVMFQFNLVTQLNDPIYLFD